jgi:hypothetical protein
MSKARLAGPRQAGSAAHHPGQRDVVMWGAERALADQGRAGRHEAGDGVDARHLERLLGAHRRQDSGEPPREHRLSGPGRSGEQQVVSAGRRDLERLLGHHLTSDLAHVLCLVCGRRPDDLDRRGLPEAPHPPDALLQRLHGDDLDAADGRALGRVDRGTDDSLEPLLPAQDRGGQHARDPADRAVQRELSDDDPAVELGLREELLADEDSEGKRQVEVCAFFAQRAGREVRDYPLLRPFVVGGQERGPGPLLRLCDGFGRQADDAKCRDAGLRGHFHVDQTRLGTHECNRFRLRQHD